jgi:hypothetical protein
MKSLFGLLLIAPVVFSGSGGWSEVDYDGSGNPYISIENYGEHERVFAVMTASGYDCSLTFSSVTYREAHGTEESFVATNPKFRVDKQAVIHFPELRYVVEHEIDGDDGMEYAITTSEWVPNDQFMTGFVSGGKLIYTHDGIGTTRWSLRNSARRLSELYQKCSLTAIEEDEWNEEESFSESQGGTPEWSS